MTRTKTTSKTPKGGRARLILERMNTAMASHRHAEAARLFKEGQSCRAIPADGDLAEWLEKSLGTRGTRLLARAFAETPCFFCRNGRESCERCDGDGRLGDAMVCETCLGLGITRCAYCDGSGWVVLDYVPTVLALPVLTSRTNTAIDELKALVRQPIPEPARRNSKEALKRSGATLMTANSLLGVLENTVTAVKRFGDLPSEAQAHANKLVETSVRAATTAEQYVRKTLKRMATQARIMAESSAQDSVELAFATTSAVYYEKLVGSEDYSSTSLDHPFLRKAMSQYREGKKKKRNTSDGTVKGQGT